MTVQATPLAVGKLLADAVAEHVLEVGPVTASKSLQCSRDTAAAWRDARDPFLPHCYAVGASLVAQRDAGDVPVMRRLTGLLFGTALGHAEDVDNDVMQSLATLGAFFSAAAEAMGNRHVDLREAPRVLASALQARPLLEKMIADLSDQIARHAP